MGLLRKAFVLCILAVVVTLIYKATEKEKLPIIIGGSVEPGFEEVLQAFRGNFESGVVEQLEGGTAFAAYYKGKQVVNIWGGYADYEAYQPWREDTMAVVFSVSKGMASICMAILVDRGLLDYEQKVVHYWPEFGQNGKENVTVKMLLQHEAGLAAIDTPLSMDLMRNYDELGRALAKSAPLWEPGTAHGYHAFTFGLYASQLLTRADPKRRTLGKFFRDEIAKPFGIEFYVGLPKELNYRMARYFEDGNDLAGFKSFFRSMMDPHMRQIFINTIVGKGLLPKVFGNAHDLVNFKNLNNPENRAVECASYMGIGTAEGLAKVYSIIANGGVTADGKRLLSENLIKMIYEGGTQMVEDTVMGIPAKLRYGFNQLEFHDKNTMGHPGFGGNNAFADLKRNLGVGFVTRYASPFGLGNDPRLMTVLDALHQSIRKLEGK